MKKEKKQPEVGALEMQVPSDLSAYNQAQSPKANAVTVDMRAQPAESNHYEYELSRL